MKHLLRDNKGQIGIDMMIVFIAVVLIAAIASAVMISVSNELHQRARSTGMQAVGQSSTGILIDRGLAYASQIPGPVEKVALWIRPYAGGEAMGLAGLSIEVYARNNIYTYRYNPRYMAQTTPENLFLSKAFPPPGVGGASPEIQEKQQRISELESMIEKEENKRRPNADKIEAWNAEIQQLNQEITRLRAEVGMGRPFGVISISDGDGSMASAMPSMNTGDVAIICLNTKGLLGNVGERVPVEIRMYPEIGNAAIMRGSTTSTIVGNVMELL